MYLPDIAERYLKILKEKEKYTAYAVNDYEVVEGIGTIESNGSWNYHNNYDDSVNTLHFQWDIKNYPRKEIKWWTLSKEEAEEKCNAEIIHQISLHKEQIEKLEEKIIK